MRVIERQQGLRCTVRVQFDLVIDGAPHDPSRFTSHLPAAKGGLPSDIANAVLYLTSELGQYVNGETILVDGGMIATKKMQD